MPWRKIGKLLRKVTKIFRYPGIHLLTTALLAALVVVCLILRRSSLFIRHWCPFFILVVRLVGGKK